MVKGHKLFSLPGLKLRLALFISALNLRVWVCTTCEATWTHHDLVGTNAYVDLDGLLTSHGMAGGRDDLSPVPNPPAADSVPTETPEQEIDDHLRLARFSRRGRAGQRSPPFRGRSEPRSTEPGRVCTAFRKRPVIKPASSRDMASYCDDGAACSGANLEVKQKAAGRRSYGAGEDQPPRPHLVEELAAVDL